MSTPKDRLRALDEGLWVADHDFKVAGLALGTRTTVIRLADGGLWVHSPGPLTDALAGEIRAVGPVRCLVAPNLMHHLYLGDWIEAFPDARSFAVAGLDRVRPELRLDETLGDEPPAVWKGQIEQRRTHGVPKLDEVVFYHPATRTLVLTDLCFNMQSSDSWLTRVGLRINGAWQRFTPSRLFKSFIDDGEALRRGVEQILEWQFERVVLTHGDVLEGGGRQALREAYAFLGVAPG
jgi:hypothetical protein